MLQLSVMARQAKQIDADSPLRPPVRPRWLSLPQMRYQNAYVWILFFSSLDVILTYVILRRNDGSTQEVNPIAQVVIEAWGGMDGFGMAGASVLKFALVALAIVICEVVGRTNDRKGKYLAWVLAGIAAVPVVWSLILLFTHQEILVPI